MPGQLHGRPSRIVSPDAERVHRGSVRPHPADCIRLRGPAAPDRAGPSHAVLQSRHAERPHRPRLRDRDVLDLRARRSRQRGLPAGAARRAEAEARPPQVGRPLGTVFGGWPRTQETCGQRPVAGGAQAGRGDPQGEPVRPCLPALDGGGLRQPDDARDAAGLPQGRARLGAHRRRREPAVCPVPREPRGVRSGHRLLGADLEHEGHGRGGPAGDRQAAGGEDDRRR